MAGGYKLQSYKATKLQRHKRGDGRVAVEREVVVLCGPAACAGGAAVQPEVRERAGGARVCATR